MSNPPDTSAIKDHQQAAWASGNYSVIGTALQLVGENLVEACDFRWGDLVVDVAAGNGNAALAAARVGCRVTAVDYVSGLLDHTALRARAMSFRSADAESLPFDDEVFDGVLSTFGVMFAPDQYKSASELSRVCRPRGKIGLANWTPGGFVGQMFKIVARHVSPPAGVRSASMWGLEAHVRDLFAAEAAAITFEKRHFRFRYRSASHFIDVFRNWYGPVRKAFESLGDGGATLEKELTALLDTFNTAGSHSLVVPAEYLQAVIVRL
jgi:ubiquinone/menaquinone biosynthesis C-methylase UbiE